MISDIDYFCERFYSATFVPISHYRYPDTQICTYPPLMYHPDQLSSTFKYRVKFTKSPDYYISDFYGYLGFININHSDGARDFLIIGPIFSSPCTEETIRAFLRETQTTGKEQLETLTQFFLNAPRLSFSQFTSMLGFVHFLVNEEKLDVHAHFGDGVNDAVLEDMSRRYTQSNYVIADEKGIHNTYEYELRMLELVKAGQPDRLMQLILDQDNQVGVLHTGKMAQDPVRSFRNQNIVMTGQALRAAISGGLDVEQAYQLGDMYIQEMERMPTPEKISSLCFSMLVDFATRVSRQQLPIDGMSEEVYRCMQYICQHTNEPIRVSDVAAYIGKSRTYITTHFKKELGFDISDYIMHTRLEEAKSLLTYTDRPLSEISSYLCFSSQSYFQNVFKKQYGVTPLCYRKEHRKK